METFFFLKFHCIKTLNFKTKHTQQVYGLVVHYPMLTSSHWFKKQKRRKRRREDAVLNETQAIRPKADGDAAQWLNDNSGVLLMMQA